MLEAGRAARLLFCADGRWKIDGDCILNQGDHVLIESGMANDIAMLEAGTLICVDVALVSQID